MKALEKNVKKGWKRLLGILMGVALAVGGSGAAFGADTISSDTPTGGNGGITKTADSPSLITGTSSGDGIYTITEPTATVTNLSEVTVQGSDGHEGRLVVEGGRYNNIGTTEFVGAGAVFELAVDGLGTPPAVENSGTMIFNAGSAFYTTGTWPALSTPTIANSSQIYIDTGMKAGSATRLIGAIDMTGAASITITGASSGIGSGLVYNRGQADSDIILSTTGNYTGVINLYQTNLVVTTTTAFQNTVDAANVFIDSGTSTFQNTVNSRWEDSTSPGTYYNGIFSVAANSNAVFASGSNLQNGAVNVAGKLTFDSGSAFTSSGVIDDPSTTNLYSDGITVKSAGTVEYHTGMNGTSLVDAFGMTTLEAVSTQGATLNLNGDGGSAQGLILANADAGTKVNIVDGGTFSKGTAAMSLDAKGADLSIAGATATVFTHGVNAANINVRTTHSGGTTFQDTVSGNLNVYTTATLDTASSFTADNITVYSGGTLNNNSAATTIAATKTFANGGTFNNNATGVLTNNGSVNNAAYIHNRGQIANNGQISNTGSIYNYNGATITNSSGYAVTNSGLIYNYTGGTVVNQGQLTNNLNSVITNEGNLNNDGAGAQLANYGAVTNGGSYYGSGALANYGQFTNTGTFTNDTTASGRITNHSGGIMTFTGTTTYNASNGGVGGPYLIANNGTVNADAGMTDASLRGLMADLNMNGAGSVFNLYADANAAVVGIFAFGASAAGAVANINPNGHNITFGDGTMASNFNAGAASLNVLNGTALLTNNSALTTTEDFNIKSGGRVDFAAGTAQTAAINARNANIESGGVLNVSQGNVLNMNLNSGAGNLATASGGVVSVQNQGLLNITGGASFASGSSLHMGSAAGDIASMKTTGNIVFAGGSTLYVAGAAGTGISRVDSNGTIQVNGATEVIFYGTRDELVGKIFLHADATVDNYQNLHNSLYRLALDTTSGQGVYVAGTNSTLDIMRDAFGEERLSINKINGGDYTDAILAGGWGMNNADLNAYLQLASRNGIDPDTAFAAFGQLYGEYGAYSFMPMVSATGHFLDSLDRQMNQIRYDLFGGCNECAVVQDVCNSCQAGGETLAIGGTGSARGRIWGGGFGDWARQKDVKYISGYDYDAYGVTLGYDYVNDCLNIGIAGAYTRGTLKVKDLSTKYKADIVNVGAYAAYTHESGVYARARLAYGYGWNDYDVAMRLGGVKEGSFKNQSYTAGAELGYNATLPCDVNLIPSVGILFTHYNQDGWYEDVHRSGNNPILANEFRRSHYNSVELPVGVRLNKIIDMGDVILMPEARVAWIYDVNDNRPNIYTGYAGSGMATTMWGVENARSRLVVGAALRARFSDYLDVALDYNFETKSRYRYHNLTGTLGVAF